MGAVPTLSCPRCGRGAPPGAAFCGSCGASLSGEIEIELEQDGYVARTAHDVVLEPGHRRGRWAGAAVAAALVVAVAASIVSGGGDGRTAPTTSAASSTTTRATIAAATTATTAEGSPTTEAASTTTTTIQVEGAGAPLLGEQTGASLLLTTTRGVLRLELDTGRAVAVTPGGLPTFTEDLVPVRGGFVGWSQGTTRIVRYDQRDASTDQPPGAQLLGADRDGRAWLVVYGNDGRQSIGYVTDARSPLVAVEPPWTPDVYPQLLADGAGGVLQVVAGGVYRWEPGGQPTAVAAGTVVAAQGGFALTKLCYPDPMCRLTVTDVRRGTSTAMADVDGGAAQAVRVSPDGRWVVSSLTIADPAQRSELDAPLVLHEVATGRTVELPVDDGETLRNNGWMTGRLAWTSDDRWLFYASGPRTLSAWREGLAEPVRIQLPTETLTGGVGVVVPE